ncbi:hypothetical protein I5L43_07040 [Serratia marcescens]|nr:hypothetical protein [Serratia marcescens]
MPRTVTQMQYIPKNDELLAGEMLITTGDAEEECEFWLFLLHRIAFCDKVSHYLQRASGRKPENPKTRKPENPKTRKPENPKTRKPEPEDIKWQPASA